MGNLGKVQHPLDMCFYSTENMNTVPLWLAHSNSPSRICITLLNLSEPGPIQWDSEIPSQHTFQMQHFADSFVSMYILFAQDSSFSICDLLQV